MDGRLSDWWNNRTTVASQDEFIQRVKSAGAKIVYVNSVRAKTTGFDMRSMALDEGIYGYFVELIAPVNGGRTIFHVEKLAELARVPLLDGKARGRQDVKSLLVAEKIRDELRKLLPGVKIVVGNPTDGEKLSPADWKRLHRDAAEAGIKV